MQDKNKEKKRKNEDNAFEVNLGNSWLELVVVCSPRRGPRKSN